jgi:glucokinase
LRVIAGDIGGTKTLLQLAEVDGDRCHALFERSYASRDYSSFEDVVRAFIDDSKGLQDQPVVRACFGVAGPVRGTSVKVTNLPWDLQAGILAELTGIESVRFINDFQAIGYSLPALGESDLVQLQAGDRDAAGPRAIIGAGTGLGEGIVIPIGGDWLSLPSEGGHVEFAPVDELQIELLRFLMARHPRVTYERILSGSGLVALYEFLHSRSGAADVSRLESVLAAPDPAAGISEAALRDRDVVAREALDLFVSIYGAQAGNLALTALATGGVYVAGGIAPKILPSLQQDQFLSRFRAKGRMEDLLKSIPVYVITNQQAGLLGAALAAT